MTKSGSYTNAALVGELITRIFADTAPRGGKANAVYLFGQTSDNEESVLKVGALLWKFRHVARVCISGGKEGNGFVGFDAWKKTLNDMGVPLTKIIGVPLAKDIPPSTDAEAIGLARFVKKHRWRTLYITSPPLHQLRAFISCVSAFKREKTTSNIYSHVGFPQRWEEHVVHSQGIQRDTRSALIRKELKKIEEYCINGKLIKPRDVLQYMNRRDMR